MCKLQQRFWEVVNRLAPSFPGKVFLMNLPQQPNNRKRRTRTDDKSACDHGCQHCQHCKYAADKARDDLPIDVVAVAEKDALDDIRAAFLLECITEAASFRVAAQCGPIKRRRFFETSQQFSRN